MATASLSEKQRMTEGPILRKIIAFVVPLFLSNIFQQMYNFADSAMVGRWVDSGALAAVGSCGVIFNLEVSFFTGLATGAGIVISRHFGARRDEDMRKAIHTTIALSVICGVLLSIVAVIFSPFFLKLVNTPDDVMDYCVTYLRTLSAGIIFMLPYNLGMGILRAVGDSKRPLYFLIVSGLSNVALNALFIYVCRLGVMGAALGTVGAQFITMVCIFYRLMKTDEAYKVRFREIAISRSHLKEILTVGIPTALQATVGQIAHVVMQSQINAFGSAVMAGVNCYHKIDGFIVTASSSFAMAMVTYVAQNMGAGKKERARKGIWMTVALSVGLSALMSVGAYIFQDPLLRIFTDDANVLAAASVMMRYIMPFFFLCGICEILSGAAKGMGHTKTAMIVSLVFYCGLRVAWLAVMAPIWHDIGVIAVCFPGSWFVSTVFFLIYYRIKMRPVLIAPDEA